MFDFCGSYITSETNEGAHFKLLWTETMLWPRWKSIWNRELKCDVSASLQVDAFSCRASYNGFFDTWCFWNSQLGCFVLVVCRCFLCPFLPKGIVLLRFQLLLTGFLSFHVSFCWEVKSVYSLQSSTSTVTFFFQWWALEAFFNGTIVYSYKRRVL